MTIAVVKNVPMPKKSVSGVGRTAKYPFAQMEVGDAFFVVDPPKTFSGQVTAAAKVFGRKFSVRSKLSVREVADGEWEIVPPGSTGDHIATGVWRVE